ncbi:MAG: GNAT family N-acetyltransferase [Clostridiales bacterium]|nr:GNAT family N-acetyltransferase [Clostridiales bacterium]
MIDVELRGKANWVWHFTVDPAYRQKGLATALLSHVIRLHRDKVQEFTLWVDVDNTPAVRLYQKTGYTFSAKGADEYILQCKGEASM